MKAVVHVALSMDCIEYLNCKHNCSALLYHEGSLPEREKVHYVHPAYIGQEARPILDRLRNTIILFVSLSVTGGSTLQTAVRVPSKEYYCYAGLE